MTIKNALAIQVMPALSPVAPTIGLDIESDFSVVITPTYSFFSDFSATPTGTAFDSEFSAGTYAMAGGPNPYGRYRIDYANPGIGSHQRGTTLAVIRDGFSSDFALLADPQEPTAFAGMTLSSAFDTPRHVAETYPPPAAFDSDFSAGGVSLHSRFSVDLHQWATGTTVDGRHRLDTNTAFLSGRVVRPPPPIYLEQTLPGTPADDRLGYFILGRSILGGNPVP